MKHFLSILTFVCCLLLSSCSKEYTSSRINMNENIPRSISIKVGAKYEINATGNWTTTNDFVASVSNEGIVEAKHIGQCVISNGEIKCNVRVSASTTLYTEPVLQWGMSKSKLISIEGDDYKVSGNSIGYMTNSSTAPLKIYAFQNDRLYVSGVVVKISSSERLSNHLLDRYQPIDVDGSSNLFIDAYSLEKATTIVYMELYTVEYWAVMYMNIDYFNSLNSTKSKVPEDLFRDTISSLIK